MSSRSCSGKTARRSNRQHPPNCQKGPAIARALLLSLDRNDRTFRLGTPSRDQAVQLGQVSFVGRLKTRTPERFDVLEFLPGRESSGSSRSWRLYRSTHSSIAYSTTGLPADGMLVRVLFTLASA
jgi:hypothetical protein